MDVIGGDPGERTDDPIAGEQASSPIGPRLDVGAARFSFELPFLGRFATGTPEDSTYFWGALLKITNPCRECGYVAVAPSLASRFLELLRDCLVLFSFSRGRQTTQFYTKSWRVVATVAWGP